VNFSYYEEAIETMRAQLKNPVFYVFSDDEDFIKEKFQDRANFVIVSKKGNSSIEEFYLMANCKHMIVANSSFSWWAAYLNRNRNKIIIRPSPKYAKSWVQNFQLASRMIHQNFPYPDEWLKVDSGLR
jgi:putative salt-induced outer membrane protein YdiY